MSGSTAPTPLSYYGSYQFIDEGERVTRDITGRGSFGVSFYADELVYVRDEL